MSKSLLSFSIFASVLLAVCFLSVLPVANGDAEIIWEDRRSVEVYSYCDGEMPYLSLRFGERYLWFAEVPKSMVVLFGEFYVTPAEQEYHSVVPVLYCLLGEKANVLQVMESSWAYEVEEPLLVAVSETVFLAMEDGSSPVENRAKFFEQVDKAICLFRKALAELKAGAEQLSEPLQAESRALLQADPYQSWGLQAPASKAGKVEEREE